MTEASTRGREHFDVVVLGEVLVEVATEAAFDDGVEARLGISGDALNVAAAAAAAGARVGLISALGEDELGHAARRRIDGLGISTELLLQRPGPQGVYFVHSDPEGNREFSYARSHSVGSTLAPEDLDPDVLRDAGAVIASGITGALSESAAQAVVVAAESARRFVYDPNHRPRLSSLEDARRRLLRLAPLSWLVTPSSPEETSRLLDAGSPDEAATALTAMGASNVAVTCGADGIHLQHDGETRWVPSVPAPHVIDQTGAGDAFLGATTARAVLGDPLPDAVRWGAAAASLVVGGRGGTGFVPTAAQTREHLRTASITEEGTS
ncbi:PfkB family carbohydrate kinase [Nesterenkonia suensis]